MAKNNGTRNSRNSGKAAKPVTKPAARANEVELQLRYVDVASLLLSRFTRAQVVEFSGKKWGVAETQADEYIAAAKKLIQARIAAHKAETVDEHIDALFDIVRRARGASDMRLEHDLRRDIAKLLALYPVEKHEVTGADGGAIKVQDIEQARLKRWKRVAPTIAQALAGDTIQGSVPGTDAATATNEGGNA